MLLSRATSSSSSLASRQKAFASFHLGMATKEFPCLSLLRLHLLDHGKKLPPLSIWVWRLMNFTVSHSFASCTYRITIKKELPSLFSLTDAPPSPPLSPPIIHIWRERERERERGRQRESVFCYILFYICNGAEWSKDRTQAAESIKWRPQQAYGSNQVLLSQPQTIFSTPKILTLTHR